MNLTRLALATVAAFVAYFVVGGIGFAAFPGMKAEFEKHAALMRPKEAMGSYMPVGMLGILIAIFAAARVYARMHPDGGTLSSGATYGVALAAFVIGGFVLHNYMMFNLSRKIIVQQAIAYGVEWIAVGVVIGLIYHP